MPLKTIDNLCRICVQESGAFMHIYDQYILDIRLAEIINDLCQLKVHTGDGLPEYVCEGCHGKVLEFHKFKQTSHEGQAALLSIKRKLEEMSNETVTMAAVEETSESMLSESHCDDEWSGRQLTVDSINQLLEVQIKEEPEDLETQEDYLSSLKRDPSANELEEDTFGAAVPEDCRPKDERPNTAEEVALKASYASIEGASQSISNRIESKADGGVITAPAYMVLRIGDKGKRKDKPDEGDGDSKTSGSGEGSRAGSVGGGGSESMPHHVILLPVKADGKTLSLAQCSGGLDWAQRRRREKPPALITNSVQSFGTKMNCTTAKVSCGTKAIASDPPAIVAPLVRKKKLPKAPEFKCDECGGEFRTRSSIVYHLKVPETTSTYKCRVCEVDFRNRCAFDRHPCFRREKSVVKEEEEEGEGGAKSKTRRRRYTCNVCSKSFSQSNYLNTHMLTHMGERRHTCNVCSQSFTNKGNLGKHMSLHSGDKPHSCKVCSRSFSRKHHLRLHMMTHVEDMPVSCSVCPQSFSRRSDLSRHMLTHTVDRPHVCGECSETFVLRSQLEQHMKQLHEGEEAYTCTVCPKTFSMRDELAKHMALHKSDKPHVCQICFRGYTQRGHLNEHMLKHKGIKPHACEICSKAFVRRSTLMHHILMHKGGRKTHPCSLCAKTFTEKSSLNKHMLLHTGEKPYSCSICARPFRQKNNLDTHMLLHTGKKLHSCGICAKSFSSKSNLKQHMVMHTTIASFKCHQCPFVFPTQAQLEEHAKEHEGTTISEKTE